MFIMRGYVLAAALAATLLLASAQREGNSRFPSGKQPQQGGPLGFGSSRMNGGSHEGPRMNGQGGRGAPGDFQGQGNFYRGSQGNQQDRQGGRQGGMQRFDRPSGMDRQSSEQQQGMGAFEDFRQGQNNFANPGQGGQNRRQPPFGNFGQDFSQQDQRFNRNRQQPSDSQNSSEQQQRSRGWDMDFNGQF